MTKTTNKKAVAAGLTAGLLGGAAAGMAFGIPGVTGAASAVVVQQEDVDSDTDSGDDLADERMAGAVERLREALQPLVDDGTIDAAQADDVAGHLAERAEGRFGPGKGHFGHHRGPGNLEVIEEALGMDASEIREALADGSTLADLADDPQGLIDALVAEARTHLDEAVAEGRLTAEEAAEKEADIVERITDMVNGELDRGDFEGRRGPGRWGGPTGAEGADAED